MRISDWSSEVCSSDLTIRKTDSRPAQRVVFAPAQQNLRLQGNPQGLKRSFFHRPLTAGDVIATTGQQQVDRGDMPPQLRQMLAAPARSEEHTSELQSLMRTSYAVFCLKTKKNNRHNTTKYT